jgi:hypothetical protein
VANVRGETREFRLLANPGARALQVGTIGHQFAGPLPAAYVYWQSDGPGGHGTSPTIALSIFDLNGPGLVGQVSPPPADSTRDFQGYSAANTYFGIVQGPEGRHYPFLAPGQRYLNKPHWDFLCIFDPSVIFNPDPTCGRGFRRYTASFPGAEHLSGFRHNGGWLEDVDDDGWQDINLPFLRYILTISGRTGQPLALLRLDLSHETEPDAPPDFDSGRLYGSFTPFRSADGKHDVLIAAGNRVGSFTDWNCNVSRYFAVLETEVQGSPASRRLKWSDYISFTKNIFAKAPSNSEVPNPVLRHGDLMNKCVHRVSDSVFHAGRMPITLYNYFTESPPLPQDTCLEEQWREWRDRFPRAEMEAWSRCFQAAGLPATGLWSVKVLNLGSGVPVQSWPNAYAWGRAYNLVPQQHEVFLVEPMAGGVRFDQQDYKPQPLVVAGLDSHFAWQRYGSIPQPGRPKMVSVGSGPNHIPFENTTGSSWGGIWDAQTRSRADGLVDIQLEDGTWVGYSREEHKFQLQP